LHEDLKRVSSAAGKSSETIIQDGLRALLPKLSFHLGASHPQDWGDLLATRFVQFLTTPFVVKDKDQNVVYANPAYEAEFRIPLVQLRGKSITDFEFISWERDTIHQDIQEVVESGKPKEVVAAVTSPDGITTPYRSVRFRFEDPKKGKPEKFFIGDFTFAWTKSPHKPDRHVAVESLCEKVLTSPIPAGIQALFPLALNEAPLATVIKKATDMTIVWGNKQFVELVKAHSPMSDATLDSLIGETTLDIWHLSDSHPVAVNDFTVRETGKAMYVTECLTEGLGMRTTLRFPIIGEGGEVWFIGAVSPHFQLSSYRKARSTLSTIPDVTAPPTSSK
jgi:hypothetical protein